MLPSQPNKRALLPRAASPDIYGKEELQVTGAVLRGPLEPTLFILACVMAILTKGVAHDRSKGTLAEPAENYYDMAVYGLGARLAGRLTSLEANHSTTLVLWRS